MPGSLARGELVRSRNFVGGAWQPAAGGAEFGVTDPATLERIARVADSDAADALAALDAAQAAFPAWRAR